MNILNRLIRKIQIKIKLYYIRKLDITVYFDRDGHVHKTVYKCNGKDMSKVRFEKSVAAMIISDYCDGKNLL